MYICKQKNEYTYIKCLAKEKLGRAHKNIYDGTGENSKTRICKNKENKENYGRK